MSAATNVSMEGLTIEVMAKVNPQFTGGSTTGVFDDAALWSLKVTGDGELGSACVDFARVVAPFETNVARECVKDFNSMFGYSSDIGFVDHEQAYGGELVYGNLASVIVIRALHAVMGLFMGEAKVKISIGAVAGSSERLTFDTVLPINFTDIADFRNEHCDRVLDSAGYTLSEEEMTRDPKGMSPDLDDVLADAAIYSDYSPVDNELAVARLAIANKDGTGDVLVVGDPGLRITRALSLLGESVVTVCDQEEPDPGDMFGGRCTLKRGVLTGGDNIGGQLGVLGIDPGGVAVAVCIPGSGINSHPSAATAVALRMMWCALGYDKRAAFAPIDKAPDIGWAGTAYTLIGAGYTGYGLLASLGTTTTPATAIGRGGQFNFGVYRVGKIDVRLSTPGPVHKAYASVDHKLGTDMVIDSHDWGTFTMLGMFDRAATDAGTDFFDLEVRSARTGLELAMRLGVGYGAQYGGLVVDSGSAASHYGISNARTSDLRRVPWLLNVIEARYGILAEDCSYSAVDVDPRHLLFFEDAMRCSTMGQLREKEGIDPAVFTARRVVPWHCMTVLASATFARALKLYVQAYRVVKGEKLSTYDLQRMLWLFSSVGRKGAKQRHLCLMFSRLFSGLARAPDVGLIPPVKVPDHLWELLAPTLDTGPQGG